MKITIVLPAYNEEQDLPPLLNRIGTTLTREGCDFRIIVVDDGSDDQTAEVVRNLSARWPITLHQHPYNRGLGAAILTGLQLAMNQDGVVITMDADNSHDPSVIPVMAQCVEDGNDVVIASRFQRGGQEVGVPAGRRLLSHSASFLLRILFHYPNVRDYSAGFRAYRASTLRRLSEVYRSSFIREQGFACMLELLLKLRAIGARATEVPLVLRYDLKSGASKMRILRTIRQYYSVMWNAAFSRPASAVSPVRQYASTVTISPTDHHLELTLGGE
ncbi:MAG: glycosyltransferase [Ignavibacteria bacterium]|nr:glycosyltransferase [Ignavibacteria bacterium]